MVNRRAETDGVGSFGDGCGCSCGTEILLDRRDRTWYLGYVEVRGLRTELVVGLESRQGQFNSKIVATCVHNAVTRDIDFCRVTDRRIILESNESASDRIVRPGNCSISEEMDLTRLKLTNLPFPQREGSLQRTFE